MGEIERGGGEKYNKLTCKWGIEEAVCDGNNVGNVKCKLLIRNKKFEIWQGKREK